jgi:hypothetical protein
MGLFVDYIITSSTIIDGTPEQIWDFFYHIEKNYETWHDDHDFWHWTKGDPLEVGSKIDSQETVGGHKEMNQQYQQYLVRLSSGESPAGSTFSRVLSQVEGMAATIREIRKSSRLLVKR